MSCRSVVEFVFNQTPVRVHNRNALLVQDVADILDRKHLMRSVQRLPEEQRYIAKVDIGGKQYGKAFVTFGGFQKVFSNFQYVTDRDRDFKTWLKCTFLDKKYVRLQYEYQGKKLIILDKDEFMFVAKSVSAILDINYKDVISKIHPDHKKETRVKNKNSKVTTVDEHGLYKMIFLKKSKEALDFKEWFILRVLPDLDVMRNNGKTADLLKAEHERALLQAQLEVQTDENEELRKNTHDYKKGGIIYVKTHLRDRHTYKVGHTIDEKQRDRAYATAFVNTEDFETKYVKDCIHLESKEVEKILFVVLDRLRIRTNREFFKCDFNILKVVIDFITTTVEETYRTLCEEKVLDFKHNSAKFSKILFERLKPTLLFQNVMGKPQTEISEENLHRLDELNDFVSLNERIPQQREGLLGNWVQKMRVMHKKHLLHADMVVSLEKIPMWSWEPYKTVWYENLQEFENFLIEHGRIPNVKDPHIGEWLRKAKQSYAKHHLPPEKYEQINEVAKKHGFEVKWNYHDDMWNENFEKLVAYIQHNDACPVAKSPLGMWLCDQRKSLKRGELKKDRQEKLDGVKVHGYSVLMSQPFFRFCKNVEWTRDFLVEHGRFPKKCEKTFLFEMRTKYRNDLLTEEQIEVLDMHLGTEWHEDQRKNPKQYA